MHWYLNLVGFLLWLVARKLILHLFFTLLRLGITLLNFLYALYMVLSYCISVLNLESFSLLSLIYWAYSSYCYQKCIIVLWLGILKLTKWSPHFKPMYGGLN